MKQHGGVLTVQSKGLGLGSTFIVEIPVFVCDVFTPAESAALTYAEQNAKDDQMEKRGGGLVSVGIADTSFSDEISGSSLGRRSSIGEEGDGFPAVTSTDHPTAPPAPSVAGTESSSTSQLVVSTPPKEFTPRQVLVVDDVSSNLKMMTRLLTRGGVEICVQATNGQEAVDMYAAARARLEAEAKSSYLHTIAEEGDSGKEHCRIQQLKEQLEPFDAILMDFEMPVMNGPTATARLREMGCRCLIVGVTGNVLPADVAYFKEQGADAVLPKPLKISELQKLWKNV